MDPVLEASYEYVRHIGQGSYGAVHLVSDRPGPARPGVVLGFAPGTTTPGALCRAPCSVTRR